MADDRHFENRCNNIENGLIGITFGRPMQNNVPMTAERSKLKPEVDFQYGGCLFSENRNNNISAMFEISRQIVFQEKISTFLEGVTYQL